VRGWSRVLGEQSKVLAFLEDIGKMGKTIGSISFVEVVHESLNRNWFWSLNQTREDVLFILINVH
jgi:hypothetical protein